MAFQFSQAGLDDLNGYLKHCPKKEAGLLYALHLVQQQAGYVPDEAVDVVGKLLEVSRSHIEGVLTFYTMYFRKPMGRNVVTVCSTISCALNGALDTVGEFEKQLEIETGETTPDGQFSLLKVECLGACDKAPVVMVNDQKFDGVKREKVKELIHVCRKRAGANGSARA
ncbi:MAG: NADH-quinone oxidoreductase subunit NuoE [Nitrospirae bacterium]|nr:NADH-quinone oxidoreductase subunit NuoE [Nitrospirota bacterium]